jgi:hypothetical protein
MRELDFGMSFLQNIISKRPSTVEVDGFFIKMPPDRYARSIIWISKFREYIPPRVLFFTNNMLT